MLQRGGTLMKALNPPYAGCPDHEQEGAFWTWRTEFVSEFRAPTHGRGGNDGRVHP